MAIRTKVMPYKTFGRVLAVENGHMELYITLDVGPRIIRYALPGGANFLYEDVHGELAEKGSAFDAQYGEGAYWRSYGGHRIWLTPEAMPDTYFPDNDPVAYTIEDNVITLTPNPQGCFGVAERMVLTVNTQNSEVTVRAEAKNIGDAPRSFGIWQISVMCQNGLAVVPQTTEDTGLLHNRRMSLWPYCNMHDPRVYWGKTLITLRQDPMGQGAFKIGTSNRRGFAAYLCHNALFVKRFPFYDGVPYPDDGCNFEIYTNPYMLELESLGQLAPVAPGDTIASEEIWSLHADVQETEGADAEALEALIERTVGL